MPRKLPQIKRWPNAVEGRFHNRRLRLLRLSDGSYILDFMNADPTMLEPEKVSCETRIVRGRMRTTRVKFTSDALVMLCTMLCEMGGHLTPTQAKDKK